MEVREKIVVTQSEKDIKIDPILDKLGSGRASAVKREKLKKYKAAILKTVSSRREQNNS